MSDTAPAERSPDRYLERIKRSARRRSTTPVRIDLRPLALMSHAEVSVVANGLLGSLGDIPLEVQPVPTHELGRLARSGVYFAFANRTGPTELPESQQRLIDLAAWRESWSPGARQPLRDLFSSAELSETEYVPKLFGPYHAAFVQPHLAGRAGSGTDVTGVLRPWLLRLLPGQKRALDRHFVADVGRFVEELVDNVREHATRQPDGKPVCSLVDVSVTRGGHGKRLHLSVQDTGPGIVATALPKISSVLQSAKPHEIVSALLAGRAGAWSRARGLGLPRVWSTIEARHGANLSVATGVVRIHGSAAHGLRADKAGFHLDGTVVTAMFRVPG